MASWAWMRTLETPQIIIEDVSSAKEGQVMERLSSYVFACSFMKSGWQSLQLFYISCSKQRR